MAKQTAKRFDPSLSLEERSAAAFDDDLGESFDDEAPAPVPVREPKGKNIEMLKFLRSNGLDATGQKPGIRAPELTAIFDKDSDALSILLHGKEGVELETARDQAQKATDIKVRKSYLPDDVYDANLDMNKIKWFIFFMHGAFEDGMPIPGNKHGFTIGDFYVKRCQEIAMGWNVNPVIWLRETVFRLIREGRFLKGMSFDETREPDDDDDQKAENIGLIELLEYSTYQALQGECRRHGIPGVLGLTHGIKDAIDKGIFRR